jgi:hypothetical protein
VTQSEKQPVMSKKQAAIKLIEAISPVFHGTITLHVADGVPKKIKIERVEDL